MYPYKLKPAFKDYIWGGTRLKTEFDMVTDTDPVAEAWVLSAHKDGASVVENGDAAGLTLTQAVAKFGGAGSKADRFEFFPMLIKLIDARENLSIQVHPEDSYALKNEGQYGKTEMWYVVGCDKGAYLYYGFNRTIDKDEFRRRIENNTLLEVLNKVNVKQGDCFFIEAGTIHAIGAGLLIAEVQQNSNLTYRVYDYGRVGADGSPRELYIDKALEVTVLSPPVVQNADSISRVGGSDVTRLAVCEYFTANRVVSDGEYAICRSDSFTSLLVLDGAGTLSWDGGSLEIKKGDSFFIPAGLSVKTNGDLTMLESFL
ncbi:MAG: class I mannose-6-phosphate isomerase [Oscillospiraceae bacterium]|nr:class I mannose-6-phosphate isomerase [Oscillospiraceae bacterium]